MLHIDMVRPGGTGGVEHADEPLDFSFACQLSSPFAGRSGLFSSLVASRISRYSNDDQGVERSAPAEHRFFACRAKLMAAVRIEARLTERSSFYYGWVNLTLAALAMTATFPGRTHGLGMINKPMQEEL